MSSQQGFKIYFCIFFLFSPVFLISKGEEILENETFQINFFPENGSFSMLDKRNSYVWSQEIPSEHFSGKILLKDKNKIKAKILSPNPSPAQ